MSLPIKPPTRLPALMDEERMISHVATLVTERGGLANKENSRKSLAAELQKGLRQGLLSLTTHAIYAADRGDEIADAALRTVYAEMAGGMFPERGPGHLQIWAYGQRAVLRAPAERQRGHRWHDDWVRNIQICCLIHWACGEFGVRPTRNRAARRAKREPSGISIVVEALARNKNIHLDEASVQENLWLGLAGEIVRSARGAP
jgi:hypothetical protein